MLQRKGGCLLVVRNWQHLNSEWRFGCGRNESGKMKRWRMISKRTV
jgi:hypothetical protein